jgi:hypothetical protein
MGQFWVQFNSDTLYGVAAERMMLHAERLRFDHPQTGSRMTIEAEVAINNDSGPRLCVYHRTRAFGYPCFTTG